MKKLKLLSVGGGSGGHVTPIVPVINELSKVTELEVTLVVDKKFYPQAQGIMKNASVPVKVKTISSGKLRRYADYKWYDYLKNPDTVILNIIDAFKIGGGLIQSLRLLRNRPDVIFAKGGFVSLPLGIAAHLRKIPMVIHDSDARAGLTNKVLSRYATKIATGTPVENYPYKKSITTYTGVPIKEEFRIYSQAEKDSFKESLGFQKNKPLIVLTGGSLGAQTMNEALLKGAQVLIDKGIQVFHITGKDKYDDALQKVPPSERYQMVPFVYEKMNEILGAADIVISRASATTVQELAGLGVASILIPAKQLGDQLKNAQVYKESESAVVLTDQEITESNLLIKTIFDLLENPEKLKHYGEKLHQYAKPNAAKDIAQMILDVNQ